MAQRICSTRSAPRRDQRICCDLFIRRMTRKFAVPSVTAVPTRMPARYRAAVAKVLLLDDDTVRAWYRLYEEDGIEGLASFGYEGGACRLSEEQQEKLKAWISETLPRMTREVGAWIERECGIEYQGRSGLIALLHRLGMEHRKPKTVSRKLDPKKQAAFIKAYEVLLNQLEADEVVLFADAVHPTHAAR